MPDGADDNGVRTTKLEQREGSGRMACAALTATEIAGGATRPGASGAATLPADNTQDSPIKCCCGSEECVFLKHNHAILDSVEKDVHTAARMGQALLARHEAYMADAERDRSDLTERIEQLETDNRDLEARNARTVQENRDLLDQLEALNSTNVDSESRIKSLEATLLSSQQTIRRLESDTARITELERQLALLEQEQADLQSNLSMSRQENRSTMSRWKRAERGIVDLQEQLDRIEKEASEEKDQHLEMIARFEKQREMEKELNTAAGRLKGAAAAKHLQSGKNGNNVVSHFVRDLLHDNSYLQHGISELKEMLLASNDEIQALRDQLAYHQPLGDAEVTEGPSLMAELEVENRNRPMSPKLSQELHIHHHYHVQNPNKDGKKAKKKRHGLTPGIFIPPASSTVSTPSLGPQRLHSQQHSRKESRWSNFSDQPSDFALSSVPSSPRSAYRNSSLFDPTMDSRPDSPATSVDPVSPTWRASHRKQSSSISARSFRPPTGFSLAAPTPAQPILEETATDTDEPDELADISMNTDDSANDEMSMRFDTSTDDGAVSTPRLRRVMSHDSIMSLSGGLDIHTLRSRPSQLTLRHLPSATSLTASSTVTAQPIIMSRQDNKRSSALLRDNFEAFEAASIGTPRAVSNPSSEHSNNGPSTLGRWKGWRPWGTGGTSGVNTVRGNEKDSSAKYFGRSAGINQPGSIPGFSEFMAAARQKEVPSNVSPETIDREALNEGLGE